MTATTALATALRQVKANWRLDYGQEMSGQASGRVRVADVRDPRWVADIASTPVLAADFDALQALVESLDGGAGTFLLWNAQRQYPQADPGGTTLGASTVTVLSVGSDNKSLALQGLPTGYELRRGDLVQVTYASPLTNIALHRVIAASVIADGDGETEEFEVRPHILTGMAEDDTVNLKRPAAEMMIVPGSYDPDFARLVGTIAFQAAQVR